MATTYSHTVADRAGSTFGSTWSLFSKKSGLYSRDYALLPALFAGLSGEGHANCRKAVPQATWEKRIEGSATTIFD